MTTTTTAVVQWDAAIEAQVRDIINAGKSVPKAIVMVAPKGFVAGVRKARRATIMDQSDRLLGEMRQNGYKLMDVRERKVNERTGDERVSVTFGKLGDPVIRVSKELGLTGKAIEALRALVNQAGEKRVAA